MYQLQLYHQNPIMTKPITYAKFTKLEHIPCASLLIRVEKAARGENGNKIRKKDPASEKLYQDGTITYPPKYEKGKHNTKYCTMTTAENTIWVHKKERPNQDLSELVTTIKERKFKDKKYNKIVRKRLKKRKNDGITDSEFLENIFMNIQDIPDNSINMIYFSSYVSKLGFKFGVDLMFNVTPGQLYIVLCSLNPPGSLYGKDPTFDKVLMYTDIDFKSPVGMQKFLETFYTIKNVPVDYRTHIIIDIKSVKLRKNAATEIKDFAWTVFPVFSILDNKSKDREMNMYCRSGHYMLPLLSGGVRPDIISQLRSKDDCWAFLRSEDKRKVSSVNFLNRGSILIRCIDNQRETHFEKPVDIPRIQYNFWGSKKESYLLTEKTVQSYEKGNQISSLIPSGKDQSDIVDEINALLRTVYKLPI